MATEYRFSRLECDSHSIICGLDTNSEGCIKFLNLSFSENVNAWRVKWANDVIHYTVSCSDVELEVVSIRRVLLLSILTVPYISLCILLVACILELFYSADFVAKIIGLFVLCNG